MSADWYTTLISQRRGTVTRKIREFKRLVEQEKERRSNEPQWMRRNLAPIFEEHAQAERWHYFFEEVSLFTAFFEATNGPKQNIREVYFARVCPKAGRSYAIPQEGQAFVQSLALEPTVESLEAGLSRLPVYSWFLRFRFKLATPYLSKDDAPFYVIDNPVRKDKILRLPMVAPTSWKGSLRAVLRSERGVVGVEEERSDPVMIRLFGNVKGEEEQDHLRAGRLHFFPTFFNQIGQEVINPHDREGGAGKQPIYFECVPQDAEGVFTLLYVPLDPLDMTEKPDEQSPPQTAIADMITVVDAVASLFTVYGFGAKTNSGFGTAQVRFPGEKDPTTGQERKSGVLRFRSQDRMYRYRVGDLNNLYRAALAIRDKIGGAA